MVYKLHYSKNAIKQLEKTDPNTARIVIKWLDVNVNDSIDPRSSGKPLEGKMAGYWRYRIGKIRAICFIDDVKLVVLAIHVGKHENIYEGMKGDR